MKNSSFREIELLLVVEQERAYFNHEFIESSIQKIVELKQSQNLKDFLDYIGELVQFTEEKIQAFLEEEINEDELGNIPSSFIKEVTFQDRIISCEAGSFMARLYNELGRAFMYIDDFEKADSSFQKAIEYDAENIITWYNIADISFHYSKFKKAIEYCDKILEVEKNYVAAIYLKALILSTSGEPAKALEYFKKTVELDADSLGGNYWAGECLLHEQNHAEALEYFKKSYELSNKSHKESARGYAICELLVGDPNITLEICDALIESDPGNQILAIQIKGDALIALGQIEAGAILHRDLAIVELDARDVVLGRAHNLMREKGKEAARRYAAVILAEIPDMLDGFAFIHEAHTLKKL